MSSDRGTRLRELAADVREREGVRDAWTAKSFTDRLFVVECPEGADLPADVRDRLRNCGLLGYNEVHDVAVDRPATAGDLEDCERYRFVDTRARGELQSYVVE